MNWIELHTEEQIEQIKKESNTQAVLIFKHSTRCSVSATVLGRLKRNWKAEKLVPVKMYCLDLLSYRNISQRITESFDVEHESPQVLILKDGSAIFVRSHLAIAFDEIQQLLLEIK